MVSLCLSSIKVYRISWKTRFCLSVQCEAIEKRIQDGQADSGQTIQFVAGNGLNAYVRGLR